MKQSVKFGFKSFFRNPIRAVISLLLVAASVGFTGVLSAYSSYDMLEWERYLCKAYSADKYWNIMFFPSAWNSLEDPGRVAYASQADFTEVEQQLAAIGGGYAYQYQITGSSHESEGLGLYSLGSYFGTEGDARLYDEEGNFAPFSEPMTQEEIEAHRTFGSTGSEYLQKIAAKIGVIRCFMSGGLVWYSGEEAIEEFGYTLTGRLPQEKTEVAIPWWMLNSFVSYGYRDTDGTVSAVTCAEDMLGKKLALKTDGGTPCEATVVGVLEMDEEAEYYTDYLDTVTYSDFTYPIGFTAWSGFPPYFSLAVSKEYWDEYRSATRPYARYLTVARDSARFDAYFDLVTSWRKGMTYDEIIAGDRNRNGSIIYPDDDYVLTYYMPYPITLAYQAVGKLYDKYIVPVQAFEVFLPLLYVFSSAFVLFLSFSTVFAKRKSVGILQSMGISRKRLFASFAVPLLLFGALCGGCALGVELYYICSLNTMFHAELFGSRTLIEFLDVMFVKYLHGTALGDAAKIYYFSLPLATGVLTFVLPIGIAAVSLAIAVAVLGRIPVLKNLNRKPLRFLFFKKKRTKGKEG